MRILFFADLRGYAHDKKWIFHFARQRDVQCFVILLRENFSKLSENDYREINEAGIIVLDPIDHFSLRNFIRTLKNLSIIRRLIHEKNIDLIHVMYTDPNALWGVFEPVLKRPIILTTRGSDLNVGLKGVFEKKGWLNRVLFTLYKRAFNNAKYITCTSQDQIDKLKNSFELRSSVVLVRTGAVPDNTGVDLDVPGSFGLSGRKFVLFPRSQRPVYYHEFAIEAITRLPADILREYTFVFVNSDSPDLQYVSKIKQLMKEHSEAVHWNFLPTLTSGEIFALYSQASLVVMTPLSDGSPVSAMEAMMAKVPVLLPPLNYDREVFAYAFSFKRWDAAELSQEIFFILNNPYVSVQVEKAYKMVMEKGNFHKEMDKVLALYDSLKPRSA